MKLSLRAKAILFFTFGAVLFTALIFVSYRNLSHLSAASQELAEEMEEAGLVNNLQQSIHKMIMPPNDYLIHGNPVEKRNFKQAVKEFEKLLTKLKGHSEEAPKEMEIYKRIIEPYQSAKNLGARIMALASPVGHPSGAKWMEEMETKQEKVIELLNEFYVHAFAEAAEVQAEINHHQNFLMVFFIFAGLILMAGTIGSYFIFKHIIIKPILQLNLGISSVARGNFDQRLNIKTGDEIGDLAASFNKMTQDLKKSRMALQDYTKNLQKMVAERTAELEKKTEELEKEKTSLEQKVEERTADLAKERASLEQRVAERTADLEKAKKDLEEKVAELEEFHDLAVGRELKMIELEKEVDALLKELGREPKYKES